jgi:hypothetical protein
MVGTLDEAREKEKAAGDAIKSKPNRDGGKPPADSPKAKPEPAKPSGATR